MKRLAAMLALSAFLAGCGGPEPTHQGQPLRQWIERLNSKERHAQQAAVDAVVAIGPAALPALESSAQRRDWNRCTGAGCALLRLPPEGPPIVRRLLEHGNLETQNCMASAMCRSNVEPDVAVRHLLRIVNHSDPVLRKQAIAGLAELSPDCTAATAVLAEALHGANADIRWRAAYGLLRIGPGAKEAIPDLVAALSDPDDRVRQGAVQALGAIGPAAREPAQRVVTAALHDRNAEVRWQAGQVLKHWNN